MQFLVLDFYSSSYLNVDGCVSVQAPKRNHPVLMLSGIGTNAIGFDLDPKVRSPPFPHHRIRDSYLHFFILGGRLKVSFNMRVKCRKNRWTLCMRIWYTYGLFSNFVSLSCSVYRNWSFLGRALYALSILSTSLHMFFWSPRFRDEGLGFRLICWQKCC